VAGALVLAYAGGALLWGRERLLINGGPAPLPVRPGMVFSTLIVSDDGRAGVAYFAASRLGQPLCLLDCALTPLSPSLLHNLIERLMELTQACAAQFGPMVFTTSALAEVFARMGQRTGVEIIDGIVADEALALSAAVHVGAERVRVCADVLAKSYPLTFLQGAPVRDDDDPLRIAFITGIAVALDTNRSTGRRAA
jgi:hypothetical protein